MNIAKLILILISIPLFAVSAFGQEPCGCYDCPEQFEAEVDTFLLYYVDGIQNNQLETNPLKEVRLNFSTDEIGDLELFLHSPSGQILQLTGTNLSARQTLLSTWDIRFVDCEAPLQPDPGIPGNWSNSANWVGFTQYTGSYLPAGGCLSNFNSNQINGIWTLYISDRRGNGSNRSMAFFDFELVFADETGRQECFNCDLAEPTLNTDSLMVCEGAPELVFDDIIQPTSDSTSARWLVIQEDTISDILSAPDMRLFEPGKYDVYEFRFVNFSNHFIYNINPGDPITIVEDSLKQYQRDYCGNLSDNSKFIYILGNEIDTQSVTLCAGDSIPRISGSAITTGGIFFDTLSTDCNAIVRYEVSLIPLDTISVDSSACGSHQDTLIYRAIERPNSCDSVLAIHVEYFPEYNFSFEEYVCELPEITERTDFLTSIYGCDSTVTIRYRKTLSDTIRINNFVCNEPVPLPDTSLIGGACDSIIINLYSLKIPDTSYIDSFICASGVDTVLYEKLDTTSCPDIQELRLFYKPTYFSSDTNIICPSETKQIRRDTFTTFFGCDSIVEITYLPLTADTIVVPVDSCAGTNHSDTLVLKNNLGCDSVVVLNYLDTLLPAEPIDSIICGMGQDTFWLDTILQENNCNLLQRTNLLYKPNYFITLEDSVCQATPNDTLLLKSQFGCDSIIINTYEVVQGDTTLDTNYICRGEPALPDTNVLQGRFCDSIVITLEEKINIPPVIFDSLVCQQSPQPDTTLEQRLISSQGCDSLVQINIQYRPTFLFSETKDSCELEASFSDTLFYQTQAGCDSLYITSYVPVLPDTLRDTIVNCDISESFIDSLATEGAVCPTILLVYNQAGFIPPTVLTDTICDAPKTNDTLRLTSALGCDSLVIQQYTYQEPYVESRDTFICGIGTDTTVQRTLFQGDSGCDSTLLLNVYYLSPVVESDTIWVCKPDEARIDTQNLKTNQGCDSIQINYFVLESVDTLRNRIAVCSTPPRIDTLFQETNTFCPRVVINTFFDARDTIRLEQSVCDSADLEPDTLVQNNIFGCDSLIILNKKLERSYSFQIDSFVCGIPPASQVLEYQTVKGCDSIYIINFISRSSDTTFREVYQCPDIAVPFDTVRYTNQFDCDSVVVTEYLSAVKDTIRDTLQVCFYPNGNRIDSTFFGGPSGCDTLQITTYILEPPKIIDLEQATCNPDSANIVTSFSRRDTNGCREIVRTLFIYRAPEVFIDTIITCGEIKADSVVITPDQYGCDSLIRRYVFRPTAADTIYRNVNVCNAIQELDTIFYYKNRFGCDSLVFENRYFIEPVTTYDTIWTCNPDAVDTKRKVLQTIGGCDSLIQFEITALNRRDFVRDTAYLCDIEISYMKTDTFQNIVGCDSVVQRYFMPDTSLDFNLNIQPVSCHGQSNGQIQVNLAAGLSIEWEDGFSAPVRSGLDTGHYRFTIASANCDTTISAQIIQPDSLSLEIIQNSTNCVPNSGVLQAVVKGGQRPYSYLWSNNSTQPIIQDLGEGTFIVQVTDASNCTISDTVTYQPIVPPDATINVRHISCAGNRDGRITFEFPANANVDSLRYFLNGISLRPDNFTNLRPGTYSIRIEDENNCALNRVVEILEPDTLKATVDVRKRLDESYNLTAQPEGGTAPFTYLWHNGRRTPSISQNNPDYSIEITDINGCRVYLDSAIPTSNEKVKNNVLEMYPNPTNTNMNVNIEGFGNLFPLNWVILSVDGKVLLNGTVQKEGITELPTERLPSGMYIFKAYHPSVIFINQIVKID